MSPPTEIAPKINTTTGEAALADIRGRAHNPGETISADIYGAMAQRFKEDPKSARAFNDQLYNAAKNDPEMRRYLPEINLVDGKLQPEGFQDATSDAANLAGAGRTVGVQVDSKTGTINDGGTTTNLFADGQVAITDDHRGHVDIGTNGHTQHFNGVDSMKSVDEKDPAKGVTIHQPGLEGRPETSTVVRPDGSYDTTIGKSDNPNDPNLIRIHGDANGTSRTWGKNFQMDANADGTTTGVSIANADGTLSQLTPKEAATAKLGKDGSSLTYDREKRDQITHVAIGADGKETQTFTKPDEHGATGVVRDKPGSKITEKDFPNNVKVQLDEQGNISKWIQGDGHGGTAKEFSFHHDQKGIFIQETTPGHVGTTLRLDREAQVGPDGVMHFTESGFESQSLRTNGSGNMVNDERAADTHYNNWNK
jgi:hypothetical protein